MRLTDEQLLDFDMKQLGGLDRAPRTILAEFGDAYRYQLLAARWIQQWQTGCKSPSWSMSVTARATSAHFEK